MLELKNVAITKTGENTPLISIEHLSIAAGEIVVVMGASGSGKSTLLNWLIGAPLPDFQCSGEITLNGECLTALPTAQRRIGIRLQQPWLFPHFTVLDNLVFAVSKQVRTRKARREKANELLASLDLQAIATQLPETLSGGQAARIALARALINEPHAMLLDEPFSALDSSTRDQVKQFTFNHLQQAQIPCLLVTHEQSDCPEGARILHV